MRAELCTRNNVSGMERPSTKERKREMQFARLCTTTVIEVLFLWSSVHARAQDSKTLSQAAAPVDSVVTAEVLLGSDRLDFKGVVLKPFAPQSHFDFLSVTVAQGEQNNSATGFDFVNVTNVNYDFYKGIGANAGVTFDRSVGFNVTVGLQYAKSIRAFNILWDPSFFPNGTHDVQNYLEADLRPAVAKNWRLYENLQVFDDFNPKDGVDERRFLHARSGARYKRFGFGFGCDFDWYGTPPSYRTNYGPVLGYSF